MVSVDLSSNGGYAPLRADIIMPTDPEHPGPGSVTWDPEPLVQFHDLRRPGAHGYPIATYYAAHIARLSDLLLTDGLSLHTAVADYTVTTDNVRKLLDVLSSVLSGAPC